jgi:hypothetical protein
VLQGTKVQAGVESATYLFIAVAVLLGIVRTFVVKAVSQYERDVSQLHTSPENAKPGDSESGMSPEEYEQVISKFDPVPVLFTVSAGRCDVKTPSALGRFADSMKDPSSVWTMDFPAMNRVHLREASQRKLGLLTTLKASANV